MQLQQRRGSSLEETGSRLLANLGYMCCNIMALKFHFPSVHRLIEEEKRRETRIGECNNE